MKSINISVINDLVTDQRVRRMAETLAGEGYVVRLTGRRLPYSRSLDDVSFRTRRFKMVFTRGPLFYLFYNFRLFFYLLFMRRPVLLVAVDLDTLPANFFVSRLRGIPLLYDSHEYFTEVPELTGRKWVKGIWECIERRIVPKLTYAMAVSDSIAKVYHEKYGTNFVTVRNVARSSNPESYPEFHRSYTSEYKIIYQGALNMGRGVELMIDTMQLMQDTVLFIVGDGDIRDPLEQRADALKLNDKVVFTGRLTPGELRRITPQCDLGLSLEEDLGLNYRMALPNKIFDYVQARIPVLCSALPEMSAIVHRYKIGETCISREPHQLVNQLTGMLKDADAREQWKLNLERAAAELCWEKEEQKLLGLVRSALGE